MERGQEPGPETPEGAVQRPSTRCLHLLLLHICPSCLQAFSTLPTWGTLVILQNPLELGVLAPSPGRLGLAPCTA